MKPLLLDLFCGAGGCSRGYVDAGFEVVGVDVAPQPRYPYSFHLANALQVLETLLDGKKWQGYSLGDFAAFHASPPCQGYTRARHLQGREHPMLLEPIRDLLQRTGKTWVIENVSTAPMQHFVMLCGTYFGLRVYRHRQFETSHLVFAPCACAHPRALLPGYVCVYGELVRGRQKGNRGNNFQKYPISYGREAMGIDWYMTGEELSQAIPPAYTEWIGLQLLPLVA